MEEHLRNFMHSIHSDKLPQSLACMMHHGFCNRPLRL